MGHDLSPQSANNGAPFWLMVLITISGTLAMHMFVPALPDVASGFGASVAVAQMTISAYILGLAAGQLIYGPLSDGIGRRPVLIVGLVIYVCAGLAAALAPNVQTLIITRLFQALGGCAGLALGRAIVCDAGRAEDAMRKLALLNVMMFVSMGLAPLLGSTLAVAFGWRSVLLLLAGLGCVTLVLTWRLLPETGCASGSISALSLWRNHRGLLRSPAFVGFAFGGGCTTASIMALFTATPFIVTVQLHRPLPEAGLYLSLLVAGMALGSAVSRRLVRSLAVERLLLGGNAVSASSAFALLAVILFADLTVARAIGLMLLFALGLGASSPAALTKSLGVDATRIGSAAGLYGFTQMAVGATCASLVGIGQNPALAAACVVTAATVLGQASFCFALAWERAGQRQAR